MESCDLKIIDKQKILIVHNFYQQQGGEDSYIFKEKNLLEQHGHIVILYTKQNAEIQNMSLRQKVMLPLNSFFNLKVFNDIRRILREEQVSIVHVHNTLALISPSVYYAALFCKIPVIQTIHNFRLICPSATLFHNGKICEDCLKKGLFMAVKQKCYRKSRLETLICVSSLKIHRALGIYKKINYICLTNFNKEKLLQINHGKKIYIDKNKVFVKPILYGLQGDYTNYRTRQNIIVFFGRHEKNKGVYTLVSAWKAIDKFSLIICGKGPETSNMQRIVSKSGISNIEFRGYVTDKEKEDLISKAFAVVIPSMWYEGFPMTILESYAYGTPIIGGDIGNVGNIILKDHTGVTFKHDDAEDLVKAVERLEAINNEEFSRHIYEIYNKKYNSEENYRQLKHIYDTVCGKKSD